MPSNDPRPSPDNCSEAARPWVLAATILGSSLAFIDGSVVNVALPAIQNSLGSSVAAAQWVMNAYLLMLGALVLVGGAAGDRFGRRRLFVLGTMLFTASSVLCGLAPDSAVLIAARAGQGIGSAMLVPNSLAIISAAFPPDQRGKAIGTWAGASALTTALGPVLGGWLVDALSWRAIFFINVPLALLALAIAWTHVPESREGDDSIDWPGGLLAIAGLACLAYGLTEAPSLGWMHPATSGLIAAGLAVLAGFVWRERRAASPLVPLSLFRSAGFSGANLITLLLYFALGGTLFFLPFALIRLQHYSATEAGASFLPFSLIMGLLSRTAGGLATRYGARPPLVAGPVIAGIGFALLALPDIGAPYWSSYFPAMIVLGIGMTISVAPLTMAVMDSVPERHTGSASGINNAVARTAGMLAVALLGALAVGLFADDLATRLAGLPLAPDRTRSLLDGASRFAELQPPPGLGGSERDAVALALDRALLHSIRVAMLVSAALALLAALCAAVTIARKPRQT